MAADETENPGAACGPDSWQVARASTFSGPGGEGVLEHGRKGLRARGVVGVVATRDCQLEILPKIEGAGEADVDDAMLRHRLIHMLAVAQDIRIDAGTMTQLSWQSDTILELLIRLYCNKLADALRQGMPQQYVDRDDDLPALHGRLDIVRQFSTLAASPQKLACRFDERSPDIALNQVMKAAVDKLSRLARAPDNQRALRELGFAYADISEVSLRRPALGPDCARPDEHAMARTPVAGAPLSVRPVPADERWPHGRVCPSVRDECPLRRICGEIAGPQLSQGPVCVFQRKADTATCLFEGNTGRFRTRPDLIIREGGRAAVIIDTKWKRLTTRIDDPKRGVSQGDVYQSMAYGRLYDCPNVVLLYPHHGGLPPAPVFERYSIAKPDAPESLIVATLNVAVPGRTCQAALRDLVMGCQDDAVAA